MTRFCPSCGTDVAVNQGHCLLGHAVTVAAPQGSLTDLRAEVDKAFDEARVQVAELLVDDPAPVPGFVARDMGPVSVGARPALPAASPQAPQTRSAPPAPPSLPDPTDPIAQFAPPPRMDWGPKRSRLRRRSDRS